MEIIGSIVIAILQSILFYGNKIGISMLIFEIIFNGILFFIFAKKNRIKNKIGILLILPIIILSSTFLIFTNKIFYIANIFIIIILNILMYIILLNKKTYLKNSLIYIFEFIINTISNIKLPINYTKREIREHINKNEKYEINKENTKKLIKSLIIVFFIVGIVLILLSSADEIFANLFSGIGNIFKNINIKSISSFVLRSILVIIIYILILNSIFKIQKENKKEINYLKNKKALDKFTVKLLLISLNLIYLIFCFIQVKSLFLERTNMNSSFNYANYARTGFFQLMFVTFINFIIILVTNRNSKKSVKILNVLLVIFTIIIAISSMYRMYMYSSEYGFTYLRIFVYIILITEIITFIPILIYIFNDKIDFLKWCFIISIIVYCSINYINIENIIVNQNINKEDSSKIDYEYLYNIATADSYKTFKVKLDNEKTSNNERVEIINILLNIINQNKNMTWQEFNISKYQAGKDLNNEKKLNEEKKKLQEQIQEQEKNERKINSIISKKKEAYVYTEEINEDEKYYVEQVDSAVGTAWWRIHKITENGKKYNLINEIEVTTPSKIKFFENGLGFLERPTSIYCGKAELLVTHDSGKTFEVINFPDGIFTLSNSNRRRMEKLL